jgi:hypothetical protein
MVQMVGNAPFSIENRFLAVNAQKDSRGVLGFVGKLCDAPRGQAKIRVKSCHLHSVDRKLFYVDGIMRVSEFP